MSSPVKEAMGKELSRQLSGNDSLFVTGYQGLPVAVVGGLRRKLQQKSARFLVVKNAIARKVFKGAHLDSVSDLLKGPSALTIGKGNPELISQVLVNFAKENEGFIIHGAYAYGEIWNTETVKHVAALPSREELIAKVLGQVQAPLYGVVGTLNALIRNLVGTLGALQAKRASEA
ncbi:MAG: 50S ribosomal protein L10 [Candidatus Omnitrophica bacterium]|nr:50S ribosomal protein L10 [Candidatus Omnitrophota bacterium]